MKKYGKFLVLLTAVNLIFFLLSACSSQSGGTTAAADPGTQTPVTTAAPTAPAPAQTTEALPAQSTEAATVPQTEPEPTTEALPATRMFTDSVGREVEVPTNIQHILPSGNMAATFLWPLCADKLASLASSFSAEALKYYGQQYKDLPITGDLYKTGSKMNIEEVARLNPDIIIDFGEPKNAITEDLNNLQDLLGIPCVFIEGSFGNSGQAYRMLGDLLNMPEEAEAIASYIEGILSQTDKVFETVPKKTLASVSKSSGTGAGCVAKGTYFDEIWSYMGENVVVVPDGKMYGSTTVSMEQLQIWDPEYLFVSDTEDYESILKDPAWAELKAVKNGNVYVSPKQPQSFVSYPSVNRYIGIIWMAEILYPDQFDWDVKAEIVRFYDMFYHCTLTEEMLEELISGPGAMPK
ncbi:MAG: ABC transporter substrate-binding protein [Lachnospiraceae bacterium]|nr:ABC transporter substrate-binding protein [Lachnospiraceae bacterium]